MKILITRIGEVTKKLSPFNKHAIAASFLIATLTISLVVFLQSRESRSDDVIGVDNFSTELKILHAGLRYFYQENGYYPDSVHELLSSGYVTSTALIVNEHFVYEIKDDGSAYSLVLIENQKGRPNQKKRKKPD